MSALEDVQFIKVFKKKLLLSVTSRFSFLLHIKLG